MKHLSTLMAMFLLVGCQTTQSAEVDTKPPPEKPKLELKEEKELKNPFKDSDIIAGTIVTSSKPVICGRIDVILNNMNAKFGEIPVMVGKVSVPNPGEDTKEIMATLTYNPKTETYTFLEQMPLEERLMCILSSGKGKVIADFLLKGTTL